MLDIELSVCNYLPDVIANRKEIIKKLAKNNATASDVFAFKSIGKTMESLPGLLEATRVQVEKEVKESAKKISPVKIKADIIKKESIAVYNNFLQSGIPLDKSELIVLDKKYFTALIKFLLLIVSLNEAIYFSCSYKQKSKKCLKQLKTEEGIFWEEVI